MAALVVEKKRRESVTSPLQLGSHLSWVLLVMVKISMVELIRMVKMFLLLLVLKMSSLTTVSAARALFFRNVLSLITYAHL